MNFKTTLSAALFVVFTTPAFAGFFDGNELHKKCSPDFREFALGYMAGITDKSIIDHSAFYAAWQATVDTNATTEARNKLQRNMSRASLAMGKFCMPDSVRLSQVLDVFCKYVSNNPESRHLNGAELFSKAMRAAWPCPVIE
ncbi:Rap1a/Tai family immunity protein [Afipia sp. Root123D2]|uniref:Rap1a/Tai family immunity protein n=1 Tax=Afipia sp. Root123D2 TaxID=1736436 RepID=UPI000A55EF5E|nr:Rap1a/Tai family immunity protein [Afipia sp. Root123D2]